MSERSNDFVKFPAIVQCHKPVEILPSGCLLHSKQGWLEDLER